MARSCPASATVCSPCSQAAEPNSKPALLDGVLAKDRWSTAWICTALGVFKDYRVQYQVRV